MIGGLMDSSRTISASRAEGGCPYVRSARSQFFGLCEFLGILCSASHTPSQVVDFTRDGRNQPLVSPQLFAPIRVQMSRRFRRNKAEALHSANRNHESPSGTKRGSHNEVSEIHCTARFIGVAGCVFAG